MEKTSWVGFHPLTPRICFNGEKNVTIKSSLGRPFLWRRSIPSCVVRVLCWATSTMFVSAKPLLFIPEQCQLLSTKTDTILALGASSVLGRERGATSHHFMTESKFFVLQ